MLGLHQHPRQIRHRHRIAVGTDRHDARPIRDRARRDSPDSGPPCGRSDRTGGTPACSTRCARHGRRPPQSPPVPPAPAASGRCGLPGSAAGSPGRAHRSCHPPAGSPWSRMPVVVRQAELPARPFRRSGAWSATGGVWPRCGGSAAGMPNSVSSCTATAKPSGERQPSPAPGWNFALIFSRSGWNSSTLTIVPPR